MNTTVNILGSDNQGGLSRDIRVLRDVLTEWGCTVLVNREDAGTVRSSPVRQLVKRLHASRLGKAGVKCAILGPPFALNIHLEVIQWGYFWLARRNVLIPNHEWFDDTSRAYLTQIDEVWVKTRLAECLFSELGCEVRFIGWSSSDRRGSFGDKALIGLHIAGASSAKGTEAVLDVWGRNANWPLLRVVRQARGYNGHILPWRDRQTVGNIQIVSERIDDQALMQLQNESALCLCPSEAEGFGHVIVESMSAGAVVVTTDAPPMNELITPDVGLLVAVDRSEPKGLGNRYFVDPNDLERKIRAVLNMTETERLSRGKAARARFECLHDGFRNRLRACLESILGRMEGEGESAAVMREC